MTRSANDVPCKLSEGHHRTGDGLIPLGLVFVEQRVFRWLSGKLGTVAWNTIGVAAGHAKPIQDRLGVFLLAGSQLTVLTASRNLHAQHERYVAYVLHLELVHEFPLDLPDHFDAGTDNDKIVHVTCEDDDDSVVLIDVHAGVKLERFKFDRDQDGIYMVK